MRRIIVCLAVLFASCGNPPEDAQDLASATTPPPASAPEAAKCADRTPKAPPKEETVEQSKPDVKIDDGAPPCELVIQDIHEGTGAKAKEGATVTVNYVGVSWSTGEEFDSSWGGEPATFPLGQVIAGWQEGIPGMKEGGRRKLIIPPDLAYGAAGRPGIAPNETLVFVIDLIKVG